MQGRPRCGRRSPDRASRRADLQEEVCHSGGTGQDRRCYTQLGKVYYKDYVTDEEPDDAEYDPLCERISQSFRRINRLRQELEAAKTKLAGEQPEDEAEPEAKPETEPETETAAEEEDFADNETPEAPEENS